MRLILIASIAVVASLAWQPAHAPAQAAGSLPSSSVPSNTASISTGDNQWALWTPMDSPAAIEAAFAALAKDYQINRIWWRGGQDELWLRHHRFREANIFYYRMWEWLRHLVEDVGTNRAALASSRKHGMSIWLLTGLFECAAQADAGGCLDLPYQCEDELRADHPEYVPVNRWGTRRQGGTIEFAYPAVRATLVKRLADFLVERGYDGVVFYTYVENFTQRYPDEFGFSEPIVAEFKKRHGIDIRTQPFDANELAKLRGEYVTQFLRELHEALAAKGKRLCMRLNPYPGQSHTPEFWRPSRREKVATAGHIYMDWERWVREGVVDELNVDWPGNDELLGQVVEACRGTKTAVSMLRTFDDGLPAGVTRVLFPGSELESGYPREAKIGWPDERLSGEMSEVLRGDDPYAKRRYLYDVAAKKASSPDMPAIIAATRDPDLYVRRSALRALAVLNDPGALPAIEAALKDPENSVRCQAAVALGDLHGPDSAARIFEAVRERGTFQFNMEAAPQALTKICAADLSPLVEHLGATDAGMRLVSVRALNQMATSIPANPSFPKVGEALRAAMLKLVQDPSADRHAREMALGVLVNLPPDPRTLDAVRRALEDPDEPYQPRAAAALAMMATSKHAAANASLDAVAALDSLMRRYGHGAARKDQDWGWRAVGNSLASLGPAGEAALRKMLEQRQDPDLAELAWRVLYQKQVEMNYCPATPEQDIEAHKLYPRALPAAEAAR